MLDTLNLHHNFIKHENINYTETVSYVEMIVLPSRFYSDTLYTDEKITQILTISSSVLVNKNSLQKGN